MEWFKKNWYWVIIVPVAGYFLWEYYKSKSETAKQMAKVREAKADKATIAKAVESLDEQRPE